MTISINSTQKNTDGSFTIKGSGISGTTVTVVSNGSQIGSGTVDNSGSFQIGLPAGTSSPVTVKDGGRKLDVTLSAVSAPLGGG